MHPSIYHWVPKEDKDKVSSYSKFNVKIDFVEYNDDEYKNHLKVFIFILFWIWKDLDPSWTKEETDYLWDLIEKFDARFLVIYDRYDPKYNRSVEDIKERYYSICKKLLEVLKFTNSLEYRFEEILTILFSNTDLMQIMKK